MLRLMRAAGLACALGLGFLVAGCGGSDDDHHPPATVADVAQGDPRFTTLLAAVEAADLGDALTGDGPITLFAPTNDAFAALLDELGVTQDELLANTDLLRAVLTYHVLPAEVPAADVPLGSPITTVQGGYFKIDEVDGGLVITDGRNRSSNVVQTDLQAGNGVVHVIDRVLLPADKTVVETAQAAADATPPQFTILVEALTAAGLVDTLSGDGPFTVFAPTDAAFAALLDELGISKADLLANTDLLTQVLTYHVVPGLVLKADVPVDTAITTVEGGTFSIDADGVITDGRGRTANLVATDTLASNGVIHVIDRVILPAAE